MVVRDLHCLTCGLFVCAVTLGDTPNFYGPEPKEQQIDQQGGVLRTSMRRGHAEMNSQAWQFFEDDTDPYGQQHMMQQ